MYINNSVSKRSYVLNNNNVQQFNKFESATIPSQSINTSL